MVVFSGSFNSLGIGLLLVFANPFSDRFWTDLPNFTVRIGERLVTMASTIILNRFRAVVVQFLVTSQLGINHAFPLINGRFT